MADIPNIKARRILLCLLCVLISCDKKVEVSRPESSEYLSTDPEIITIDESPKGRGKCIEGDCRNNQGTYEFVDGRKYIGEFLSGKINGQGFLSYPNGRMFIGRFDQGKHIGKCLGGDCFNGQGKLEYRTGVTYEGGFKNGLKHGIGVLSFPDKTYSGEFVEDEFQGLGYLAGAWGNTYIGYFKEGKRHGAGVEIKGRGFYVYTGGFKNGVRHGRSVERYGEKIFNG